MIDWGTIITAIVGALLGGGGIAAYVRARGQNRVDLFAAQAERIARLEARSDEQDKRNDDLSQTKAQLLGQVGSLSQENVQLNSRLETQRKIMDELSANVARLGTLEEENARLRQSLQIETSKREFLEREVNTLRLEIVQLRAQLPNRANDETGVSKS